MMIDEEMTIVVEEHFLKPKFQLDKWNYPSIVNYLAFIPL